MVLPALKICTAGLTVLNQVLGWVLTVGTFGSFVPQMVTLIVEKNLDGLAALTWALNYLSNMATMINAVMLNYSEIQCCQELPVLKCIGNLVPLIQLLMPTLSTFIIFTLTAMYANRLTDKQVIVEQELQLHAKRSATDFFAFIFGSNSFVRPLFVASLFITFALVAVGILLMVYLGVNNNGTTLYADIVGISAVIFLMIMYIPQLYTTYKVKHTGSLSLATLVIQCPGSLAVCYFDAFQNHMSWTTWAPYLVSAIQQFVLIIMCVYYNRVNKKKGETEPLLPSSSSPSSPSSDSPKKQINY